MTHHYKILLLAGLLLIATGAQAEENKEKPYVYCFMVDFSYPDQIKNATIKGYDHPWYRLYRPREIISATFTDFAGKHCWRSALPEMGLSMSYVSRNKPQLDRSFRCRIAPLPKEKYKAMDWKLTIKKKTPDESYPIDCQISPVNSPKS